MKRAYLEEDLRHIQKYFPGARAVTLRTPFDITDKPTAGHNASADFYHDDGPSGHYYDDLVWGH